MSTQSQFSPDEHKLKALKEFADAGPIGDSIKALDDIVKYLASQVIEDNLDVSSFDNYSWLLWRVEQLLKQLQVTEDVKQIFRNKYN